MDGDTAAGPAVAGTTESGHDPLDSSEDGSEDADAEVRELLPDSFDHAVVDADAEDLLELAERPVPLAVAGSGSACSTTLVTCTRVSTTSSTAA